MPLLDRKRLNPAKGFDANIIDVCKKVKAIYLPSIENQLVVCGDTVQSLTLDNVQKHNGITKEWEPMFI